MTLDKLSCTFLSHVDTAKFGSRAGHISQQRGELFIASWIRLEYYRIQIWGLNIKSSLGAKPEEQSSSRFERIGRSKVQRDLEWIRWDQVKRLRA